MNDSPQRRAVRPELDQTYRRHRRVVRLGQALLALGAVVLIVHWLAHIEAFGPSQPEGWVDLIAGYPTGGLLLMIGGIFAGRKMK